MAEIAWIGLGTMGVPMAKNLAAAGHHVMGIDVSAHARQRAGEAGIEVVEEMADAVAAAEFVFTMLPKGEHVRSVYEGEKGVLAQISRGRCRRYFDRRYRHQPLVPRKGRARRI